MPVSSQFQEDFGIDPFAGTYQPDQMEYDRAYQRVPVAYQPSHPSMFREHSFYPEEGDFLNQESAFYNDPLNLDLPEVAHANSYDMRPIRREYPFDPSGYDSPYAMPGHRNAFTALSQNADAAPRRYDTSSANPHFYPPMSDFATNRPSNRGEVDPLLYSRNTPRQTRYVVSDPRMHSRINSSPSIPLGSGYSENYYGLSRGYSTISASDLHSRHNSETITETVSYPLRSEPRRPLRARDSLDSNRLSISPSVPSVPVHSVKQPSRESTPREETPVVKLPYACRDFRNGTCTRGEKCRFMHALEGRHVGGK